jgi:hypothetical protein
MSAEDVERENNAARNYYFLNDLGLGDAHKETLWGGTVAPPVKRKAAGEGRKRSRKKSRKGMEVEDEGGDEGEDSEEEPEPDPETPTQTGEGNQNRGAKAARATKKGKPTREWAETADTFLGNKEYGPQWTALRALWWKREEDADFAGTVSKAVYMPSTYIADDVNAGRRRPIERRKDPRRLATGLRAHATTRQQS